MSCGVFSRGGLRRSFCSRDFPGSSRVSFHLLIGSLVGRGGAEIEPFNSWSFTPELDKPLIPHCLLTLQSPVPHRLCACLFLCNVVVSLCFLCR